jgi:tRNA-dihydrouridine synthase A
MKRAVRVPVTVKFRIGVVEPDSVGGNAVALQRGQAFDDQDALALEAFARGLLDAGADALIVHARKAVLGGLSPHENRTVPPLRHDAVAQLRATLKGSRAPSPVVPVVVNGGLRTAGEVLAALDRFDGVMIGREAYHRPALLAELQSTLYPADPPPPGPRQVLEAMREYARREAAAGTPLHAITRHMLGLLSGRPGAKSLRQLLSQGVQQGASVEEIFSSAMTLPDVAA